MTTNIATLDETAVTAQMVANEMTPEAATRRLIQDTRDALAGIELDIKRHVAETVVILKRFDSAVEGSQANLLEAERAIREDLARNLAEQDRQRVLGQEKRANAVEDRQAQLAELERQRAMYEAALAAGARVI